MSPNGEAGPAPTGVWLEGEQQRAWLAYIRVQLRLAYEMNRQLLADSGMSLPDYDVLTALSVADGGRMQITVLAAQIGWERSRVSHHVRRMSARGLVTCGLSAADRRVTEVTLTGRGRQALEEAAPGHVDLVRRLFFGAAGRPRAAAQRGTGKRVRQHHRTGLAPAARRLAPGGGLRTPHKVRLRSSVLISNIGQL
jgi:DNA-binding MarR family transcriptional regulator